MARNDRVLLVDGDILLYKFAYPNQTTIKWDANTTSTVVEEEKAVREMEDFMRTLSGKTGIRRRQVVLSGKDNFRYGVLPTYKHNRSGKEKPLLHSVLKEVLEEFHSPVVWDYCEADDVMGIFSTREPEKYLIATIDKDLQQIPGWHFDWRKPHPFHVSKDAGDLYFYTQILTGDATDGYSGCPGIGKVKAAKLLAEATTNEERWSAVVGAYEAKGLTEADAIQQAQVARICRASDYDFNKMEPVPWQPSKK